MNKYVTISLPAIIFLILGIATLSDYGIQFDAAYRMSRAQGFTQIFDSEAHKEVKRLPPTIFGPKEYISRYYHTAAEETISKAKLPQRVLLKWEYQDQMKKLGIKSSFYNSSTWGFKYLLDGDGPGHPALVDILSGLSNRLIWGKFNLLGDIESYQLVYILISTLGVFLVSLFTYEITKSKFSSIIAGLSLGLFPLFLGESHINMKDPSQAVFFTGAVWAFWHWVRDNRLKWFWVFTVFVFFALGVKWNIIFLPLILIPWVLLIRRTEEFKKWFKPKKLTLYLVLFLILNSIFLILTWPWLWEDPIGRILRVFNVYLDVGLAWPSLQPTGFILPGGFNLYPLMLFIFQTPEVILILAAAGIIGIIKSKGKDLKIGYLLLLWLFLPLLRLSMPHVRFYAGIRQIMEILPALAILAGIGGQFLIFNLKFLVNSQIPKFKFLNILNSFQIIFVFLVSTLLLLPVWQLHPNENVYFNSLLGGLKGAYEKNLMDYTLTDGNIYKKGVDWLNTHAQKDADLAFLDGTMVAISPLWLREDISFSPNHFSGFEQKGEYIIALENPLNPPIFAYRYPKKLLKPIHTIEIKGVPLLNVYQNISEHNLVDLSKEEAIVNEFNVEVKHSDLQGDYFEIDLKREVLVTRIVSQDSPPTCLGSNYEHISFLLNPESIDINNLYVIHERKSLGGGKIEYLFAAEKANKIIILPQHNFSCFSKGKVFSVSFIPSPIQ